MKHELKGADLITAAPEVGQPTLVQRSAFAVQHLMAAARFSRLCGVVETENAGKRLGAFYDEQIACVSATVMLAVASLESNINEYLEDAHLFLPELSRGARKEITELLSTAAVLQKYTRVLALKGLPPMNEGALPYQDADLLIAVRNEFVHFHPEWHDSQHRHKKLGLRLAGKFALSPFMSEGQAVMFPQRIVSHGCTRWAVNSALAFMDEFAKRAFLPSRFDSHRQHLAP